jgi:ubiquitin C-terminal hydrolase
MYIFVHRGDATSGHYWGYGRNGKDWYKYDINVARIKEADIFVDIEKSRAIPYALVYAQEKSLESFEYPYHLDFTENA